MGDLDIKAHHPPQVECLCDCHEHLAESRVVRKWDPGLVKWEQRNKRPVYETRLH